MQLPQLEQPDTWLLSLCHEHDVQVRAVGYHHGHGDDEADGEVVVHIEEGL